MTIYLLLLKKIEIKEQNLQHIFGPSCLTQLILSNIIAISSSKKGGGKEKDRTRKRKEVGCTHAHEIGAKK